MIQAAALGIGLNDIHNKCLAVAYLALHLAAHVALHTAHLAAHVALQTPHLALQPAHFATLWALHFAPHLAPQPATASGEAIAAAVTTAPASVALI